MQLDLLPHRLGIARFEPEADVPEPAASSEWLSTTRTADELSVVCPEEALPHSEQVERGWRALRVRGPLAFDQVGILAELAKTLAGAEVPIFAVSTYDTDYILVKDADLERAMRALNGAGHEVFAPAEGPHQARS